LAINTEHYIIVHFTVVSTL